MKNLSFSSLIALLLALAPVAAHAQSRTSAALRGTVTNEAGFPVAGADVTVLFEPTGVSKRGVTRADGQFLILLLPIGGPYTVTIQALGYAPARIEEVHLEVGEVGELAITLSEQAIEVEGVDVTVDRAAIFDSEQVGPLTRLSERILTAMPLPTRDVMTMAVLSPLVTATRDGGFSIGGQNDRYNAVMVDGLLAKDVFGLASGGAPGGQAGARLIPLDAVSQYEVMVAPYDVRLTGFAGGLMNAVTRGGTNEWRARASASLRNEALIGDLSLPTGSVDATGTSQSLLALSVGGPIIRDRAHFFVAGEFQRSSNPPPGFNLFRDTPELSRLSLENAAEVDAILQDQYGIDAGEVGPYSLSRESGNLFGRVDWSLENAGRLIFRHMLGYGKREDAPNRAPWGAYELSSNAGQRRSINNLTSLQYFTDLGSRTSNELSLTFQRGVDRADAGSTLPQIEVNVESPFGDQVFERTIRAGGSFFNQSNDLDMTSLALTNSLDINLGGDVLTLGVAASWFGITNEYLPGTNGEYRFASIEDLRQNRPERYQRNVLAPGVDQAISFDVIEMGAFMQRSLHPGGGLTLHAGMRVDMPILLQRPERNHDLRAFFGYMSDNLPTRNWVISPRFGFNWQSSGERKTQVRGGTGLFSGQVPYVWLANAFHYTGLRSFNGICLGRAGDGSPAAAPGMTTGALPSTCVGPQGQALPMTGPVNAVVFDEKFNYPQVIKTSIDFDHELTERLTVSLGFLFNKSFNQVGIKDLNRRQLKSDAGLFDLTKLTSLDRPYHVQVGEDYGSVLRIGNAEEDWAGSISTEIRGTFASQTEFRLGYSWARSRDRNSLTYTDMFSNYGLNPKEGQIEHGVLTRSDFDRTHKFVALVAGRPFEALPNTEFSLLYTGQSGRPFSYVYGGDVNGDGYPGPGGAFERNNDLFYVPDFSTELPLTPGTLELLKATVNESDCLRNQMGKIARRNSCRAPFEHTLDGRITHGLRLAGAIVELNLDVYNLLNLVNGDWGRINVAQPLVPLLRLCESQCDSDLGLPARWGGGVQPETGGGGVPVIVPPWTAETPASQWQMQFGVRVTMGGAS